MYTVAVAAYTQVGGPMDRQTESFVGWQAYELGSPATRFDLSPIAVAQGEVIGFATLRELSEPDAAELRALAVHPGWSGRSVATALLGTQIAGARAAGFRRLASWIPDNGPARLYERIGFATRDQFVEYTRLL
jgi:N-acetylglutamate synthase-like GNAT family acetyltransferase